MLFDKLKLGSTKFNAKLHLLKLDRRYNNAHHNYFSNIPLDNCKDLSPDDYRSYVKYGIMPNPLDQVASGFEQ